MASRQPEGGGLITLLSDTKPVAISTNAHGNTKTFYIQRTFLASASATLSACCSGQRNYLDVDNDVFHIFLAWLLYGEIKEVTISQTLLALAWRFGSKFQITGFQNAVMSKLVELLGNERVSPDAVSKAYQVTERRTLLQRALVSQLAIDMRRKSIYAWDSKHFHDLRGLGLMKAEAFYIDLTQAMCGGVDDKISDEEGVIDVADFLVED